MKPALKTTDEADSNIAYLPALMEAAPLVVYDGDCIFCANYVRMYRARKSLGTLTLWNARELSAELRNSIGTDYDLNEGMLFVNEGRVFHGADAVHALALVTSGSTFFNALNASIFRSRTLSKFLYPLLKLGRRVTLYVRGKKMIS